MTKNKRRNPDHVRRRNSPSASNEEIERELQELLTAGVLTQAAYYRQLQMRSRILNLPLMVALVLTLLWRQVPSVRELSRMLAREDLLWCRAVKVSQQALSERFLVFPAKLFEGVYKELLPKLKGRWEQRQRRPIPLSIRVAREHFDQILVADGSTLEALFRKLGSLEEAPLGQLAGKMCVVIDLVCQLPIELWFSEESQAFDTNFIPNLLALVGEKTLLILDRGFYDFQFFANLMANGTDFITRLKSNAKVEVVQRLSYTASVKERIVQVGTGQNDAPILTLRMIEVRFGQQWYRYVTSVLDPELLPPFVVADLYRRRWRIEDAFNTAKRLLNLSYLWTGSVNGIQLQIWATWLFYVVLVDLGDAVADEMNLPFERISLEMLHRGFYHFIQAYNKGKASDPIAYFAAPQNQDLDIVKRLRKPILKLDLAPYPT
jgi:hypothetical protein